MAVSLPLPPKVDNKRETQPKKRRKRAVPSGATEDCSSCRKNLLQCDRKRPYCTPCLDAGGACPGYRTTLTWGMGVASRGKLRGLSLPVAGSPAPADATGKPPILRRHSSHVKSRDAITSSPRIDTSRPSTRATGTLSVVHEAQPFRFQERPPHAFPLHVHNTSRAFASHQQAAHAMLQMHSLPHNFMHSSSEPSNIQQPSLMPHSYAQSPYHLHEGGTPQPHDIPISPGSYTFSDYIGSLPGPSSDYLDTSDDCSDMSRSIISDMEMSASSVHNLQGIDMYSASYDISLENSWMQSFPTDCTSDFPNSLTTQITIPDEFVQQFSMTIDEFMADNEHEKRMQHDSGFLSSSGAVPNASPFLHLSPRMQELLEYYDKHICSAVVAFDGAANPYRIHILGLAAENECLQNAVAALAINNMRMCEHNQRHGVDLVERLEKSGADTLTDFINAATEPSPEELHYKALAIDELNVRLSHPGTADDDAVLATLLILCLFHVCDSGFSKFKTQLVGVQKLLELRSKRAGTAPSPFISWVQMFFSWVDVITSTVNDREIEIDLDTLDVLVDTNNDPASSLEQISGCDAALFKIIGRLGRLNVLSQGREVRPRCASHFVPPSHPRPIDLSQRRRHTHTDGVQPQTPFSTAHQHAESDSTALPLEWSTRPTSLPKPSFQAFPRLDKRTAFWTEWHSIRAQLDAWKPSSTISLPPSSPLTPHASAIESDMAHINQSFRLASLLYTERLAAPPHTPPSAPGLQDLVTRGLHHISQLSHDSPVAKFLLWPLFILGSECLEPAHRREVRERCVSLQWESGFGNNLCVLEVLEKTWRGGGAGEGMLSGRRSVSATGSAAGKDWACGLELGGYDDGHGSLQAFRWRRAMDRVDGEYIVV